MLVLVIAAASLAGVSAPRTTAAAPARRLPPLSLPSRPDALTRSLMSGRLTPARYALERARALFHPAAVAARYGSLTPAEPRDATLILRDLVLRLGSLSPADRAQASAILARPSDGGSDPAGSGWTGPEAAGSPVCDSDVCVHWTLTGADAPDTTDVNPANGTPDWVDQTLSVMHDVWQAEVTTMSYRAPLDDSSSTNNGGDGKLDVYLGDVGANGLYGYCTSDDPSTSPTFDRSAYCVVDNDFAASQFPALTPLENLEVTAAHEFFHAVQFAYDIAEDRWLMEGTAAWMEDEVYDSVNDNRQYLVSSQLTQPWVPLDRSTGFSQYGAWIWFRFLSEVYDPAIVQAVWNRADGSATGPDQYSLQAVRNAIAGQGATFRQLYASFAVWNRIPALRYSEGAAYPAARAQGFAVGRRHPSTGWLGLRLKHLSSYYGTFVAGTTAPAVGHLTVNVDAPNLSLGPEARLIVRFKSGAVSVKRFLLGPLGKGTLRVGFDRAAVARVDIVLSNAGTAVSCGRNTVYSCQGTFTSENGLYLFRAFIS